MDTKKPFNSNFENSFVKISIFFFLLFCVKSSRFFCHSELLISGIQSVILQSGNPLKHLAEKLCCTWRRERKLLHSIEIMAVFFLENVTELIHHNFKERWLL